jgi:hypothetical protein
MGRLSTTVGLLAVFVVLTSARGLDGAASTATELTRRYKGQITRTDLSQSFPLGAPVTLVVTVDSQQQTLVSAVATFNGVEFRTGGPRSLQNVGSSGGLNLYYSSSTDIAGPTVGGFVPWIMTLFVRQQAGPFFSADPFADVQPFVFSNEYAAAIGSTAMTLDTVGLGVPSSLLDLNGDAGGDAFLYDSASGAWSQQVSLPGGGFLQQGQGTSLPGWTIVPANFNGDAVTDLFLFNTTNGSWAKVLTSPSGFSTQATGTWWPGWERYEMDLDGDGLSDLFLFDPATGVWFKCLSTPSGFTYTQGGWNPGWELYPMRLNGDAHGDLFLFNRTTGRWFWALGQAGAGFTYPVTQTWFPGWKLYPGDFNDDGLTDLLLHDPPTGTYVVATTGASGFAYQSGGWSLGWKPYVSDLDADGREDLFLHDATTGVWRQLLSTGAGSFTDVGGQTWSLGWTLNMTDLNGDGRTDIVLYDPSTGAWYQARNLVNGNFSYSSGTWSPGLEVIVRAPIR